MANFRNTRLLLVALSGLLAAAPACVALAAPIAMQGPPPGGRGGRGGGVTLEALTDRLKLSADQQAQIKPILADRDKAMADIRADQDAPREDRMSKMMKVRTDTDTKINAVLTDDQKAEYAKMQAEMRQRMGGGPGGGNGGPPPPPQ